MKLKEIPFLIFYSFKSLVMDLVELAESFKKAKTWSFILYATFFLAVYYKQYTLMKIALPIILILYVIRQDKEPEYNKELKEKAFLKGDDKEMLRYYQRYKKQCYFSKKEALSYEDYKANEVKELKEKRYIESDQSDDL